MAASGEDQAIPLAPHGPRARFGSDLKPRVAAALAMATLALATAWIGGFIFGVFWWLASVVILWEWQRLVGGGRLVERIAVGGYIAGGAAIAGGIVLLYLNRPHLMEREDPNPNAAGVAVVPVLSTDMVGVQLTVNR